MTQILQNKQCRPSGATRRKLVRVAVSADLIHELIFQDHELKSGLRVVRGLPKDALFVGSSFNELELIVYFFFSHDSFDEVASGAIPPRLEIQIRQEEQRL